MTLLARPITAAMGTVIDTATKISASEARALYAAGVRAVWRYVFFGSPRPGDIDEHELHTLLDAGMTVLLVQHVRNPGWTASADQGTADGRVAVANAIKAGYASAGAGLAIALDLEGCRNDAHEHAVAWCAEVRAGGYQPVVYIGYASGMTSAQLDALGSDVALWADFAPLSMRPHPARGYALHQQPQTTLAGIGVDVDTVLIDGAIYGLADGDVAAGDDGITSDAVGGGPEAA